MGNRREFDIAFVGLKPGLHEYDYEVDSKFFLDYKQTDFSNCQAKIKLTLERNTSFLMLKFEVGGNMEVVCDRCGNNLGMELWDEFNLIVKLVENPDEMNVTEDDPDIHYISRTESHLHVADWIYEFVTLSIPMQRSCKEEAIGGPQCNKEVLEMLKKMEEVNKGNNPLSQGLEKFRKNIN
ncbi:MAG: DUF177 domain-containing protein [Chitinophagaceae bacterium]